MHCNFVCIIQKSFINIIFLVILFNLNFFCQEHTRSWTTYFLYSNPFQISNYILYHVPLKIRLFLISRCLPPTVKLKYFLWEVSRRVGGKVLRAGHPSQVKTATVLSGAVADRQPRFPEAILSEAAARWSLCSPLGCCRCQSQNSGEHPVQSKQAKLHSEQENIYTISIFILQKSVIINNDQFIYP